MANKIEGPFRLSRTSDGTSEWFSARDPVSGVSIPGKDRAQAEAPVSSINTACRIYCESMLAEQTK